MYASYPCRVWFWDRVCAIGEFMCDTPVHKWQRGVTMATNCRTEIPINAFVWKITRMWLLITWGFRGRPIQRRHFWFQGSKWRCHGNQILAKIGQRITKKAITSVVSDISMQSLVLTPGLCSRGIHLWHSHTQGTKGCYHGNQFWDKNCYKCT